MIRIWRCCVRFAECSENRKKIHWKITDKFSDLCFDFSIYLLFCINNPLETQLATQYTYRDKECKQMNFYKVCNLKRFPIQSSTSVFVYFHEWGFKMKNIISRFSVVVGPFRSFQASKQAMHWVNRWVNLFLGKTVKILESTTTTSTVWLCHWHWREWEKVWAIQRAWECSNEIIQLSHAQRQKKTLEKE